MDFVEKALFERGVPDALITNRGVKVQTAAQMEKRRKEIKKLLVSEEYGRLPPPPEHLGVDRSPGERNFCAGKVSHELVKLTPALEGKKFSFPVWAAVPKGADKAPAFIHISFGKTAADMYQPTEEITDRGFAVFSFCYTDIAADNGDFKKFCAKYLSPSRRANDSSGKIMMWAWAAMRVMDYVEALPEIDENNVAVIGHSVLGKAALVTAAFDERFKYAISNNSGCSGAAISRGNTGETLEQITHISPFLFCPQYLKKTDPREKSFDQNLLLSLIPPRHLLVGSAEEDLWADPVSEFLGCASANPAYALYGKRGLVYGSSFPTAKTVLSDGDALYHVRKGARFLSREDWGVYMDFIDRKMKENTNVHGI